MRKTIAAVTAGLLLVAGQAAANDSAASRVGDRVGAGVGTSSSEFRGVPVPVVLIGTAVLIALIVVATDDDPASD